MKGRNNIYFLKISADQKLLLYKYDVPLNDNVHILFIFMFSYLSLREFYKDDIATIWLQ